MNKFSYLTIVIVWGFAILDILNRVEDLSVGLKETSNYSIWIRGLLFFIAILFFVKENKILVPILFFALISISGTLLYRLNYHVDLFLSFKFILKFLYPFVLFGLFKYLTQNISNWRSLFSFLLESIIYFHSAVVIFGALFQIDFLRSYGSGLRFGYSPPIASINEVSFFFFISITYVSSALINSVSKKNIILGLAVFISSILVGTKAIYVCLVLFLLFHTCLLIAQENRNFWFLLIVLCGIIVLFFCFVWPYFVPIIEARGLLDALSSLRWSLILNKFLPLIQNNWHWYNYFLGGCNTWQHFTEMDMIDLFSLSGIIGLLTVLYLYYITLFSFEYWGAFQIFFVAVFFLLANLSGHFMWSGVNSSFFVVLCLLLNSENCGHIISPIPKSFGQ